MCKGKMISRMFVSENEITWFNLLLRRIHRYHFFLTQILFYFSIFEHWIFLLLLVTHTVCIFVLYVEPFIYCAEGAKKH